MKYTELKNSIAEGAKSVYLLEGDDAYFREKGEALIKSAFLSMPELNYSSFDGETLRGGGLSELKSALENYPFMAEKRIVKVSEFYPSESDYETHIKKLFDNFPPTSILIIVNTCLKKGVDLKRKSIVTYVDCNRADAETVSRWVYITLRRAGVETSVGCADKIAEYCLCDMARVAVETEKIIAYKPDGALTEKDVDEIIYKDADYKIYELTNAVSRNDYTKFCEIVAELIQKVGDEMFILNGLLNYFRNLTIISTSGEGDAYLAKLLKMKEFGVKKSREQAARMSRKKLEDLTNYVYTKISEVKSGRLTLQNALKTVQNAIFFGIG